MRRWYLLCLLPLLCVPFVVPHHHTTRFVAFDVGQGDALFLETSQGYQLLVDGGPSSAVLGKLGRVLPYFDRSLDVVVMTHPDADHITGLVDVAERYHIGTFLTTGVLHQSATYDALLAALAEHHTNIHVVTAGERFTLGEATLDIVGPTEQWEGVEAENTNLTSIVARFQEGSFSVLLTGDAEMPEEEAILAAHPTLSSTVLKVGHHGSRTCSSAAFLGAVQPAVAVISAGAGNRYGHPHQEVLDALAERSIPTYRTDEGGDLTITPSADGYTVVYGLGFRLW